MTKTFIAGGSIANFPAKEKEINDDFIMYHAKIIVDFGGTKTKEEYFSILKEYRDNPLKFDKVFETLRNEALENYDEES